MPGRNLAALESATSRKSTRVPSGARRVIGWLYTFDRRFPARYSAVPSTSLSSTDEKLAFAFDGYGVCKVLITIDSDRQSLQPLSAFSLGDFTTRRSGVAAR